MTVRLRGADQGVEPGGTWLQAEDAGPAGVLALAAAWPRPVRFIVPAKLLERGLVGFVLRASDAIVGSPGDGSSAREADGSVAQLRAALKRGEVVCSFLPGVSGDGAEARSSSTSSSRLVAVSDELQVVLDAQRPKVIPVGLDVAERRVTVSVGARGIVGSRSVVASRVAQAGTTFSGSSADHPDER